MDMKELVKYGFYIALFFGIIWLCRGWIKQGYELYKHKKHRKQDVKYRYNCSICKQEKRDLEEQEKFEKKGGD